MAYWRRMNKAEAFLLLGLDHYKTINGLLHHSGAAVWNQAANWVKANFATHVSAADWSAAINAYTSHHASRKVFPVADEIFQAEGVI